MSFAKLLVANRGEIACRVMRTARALGYRSVAVYSDADVDAPHVKQADEAVHIGPAPASLSYLKIDAILDAARRTGADAVHPGYGFLSERADFAQACCDAGLVFIGPPPTAIAAMGDKAEAKRRMRDAGVPCAPGYLGDVQDDATLLAQAHTLGLPLLVKAVAGGGGRGMRLVRDLAELPEALAGARREARSAFGDDRLMLERLIENGRHIEVQVFADAQGHAIHLGERDCSAQRRRQKVIEEAPSPIVSPALREIMGRDAVAAALAVGYVGAGTVEFIVDAQLKHFFLEMNTRLQVEHPVTECITGLDLVEWQLRIAAGEPLPLRQDQLTFSGHAIEARLYAEDPSQGFRPQTGRIAYWRPQRALHGGVRIDHGIAEGGEITPFYDAMVAKLIVHGRDRGDATRRLRAALQDAPLLGPKTNARFLCDLLGHPAFAGATMHTGLIDAWALQGEPLLQGAAVPDEAWCVAAAVRVARDGSGRRSAGVAAFDLRLVCGDEQRTLRVRAQGRDIALRLGTHEATLTLLQASDGSLRYRIGGIERHGICIDDGQTLHLAWQGAGLAFHEPSPQPAVDAGADPRRARAPVAGVVAQLKVAPGTAVRRGQPLVCVEAMKMEMWLHAAADGTVRAVHMQVGEQVASGALLVEIDNED
jgi:geranyl-CoA carboxylase alpha subunit